MSKVLILIIAILLLLILMAAAYLLTINNKSTSENDIPQTNTDDYQNAEPLTTDIPTANSNITTTEAEPLSELRTTAIATSSSETIKPEEANAPANNIEQRDDRLNNNPRQHN